MESRFAKYFIDNWSEIEQWEGDKKETMVELISAGKIKKIDNPIHETIPADVAFRLYAINKWVSEQGFDIVIHIHFNDYGTRPMTHPGDFYGFTIYVPEEQYSNSKASQALAQSVFN